MERRFSITDALRFAAKTTLEHILFFLGVMLTRLGITLLIVSIIGLALFYPYVYEIKRLVIHLGMSGVAFREIILSILSKGSLWVVLFGFIGMSLLVSLVNIFFQLGFAKIGLEFYDHGASTFKSLFSCGRLVFRGLMCNLLYVFVVAIGLVLFVIPGIYCALKYAFWPQLLVDQDTGIIQTFHMSSEITQDTKMHLFGLFIVLALINWAGSFLFGVGVLITIPISVLALTYVYRKLLALPVAK